jgi:hypothetical protein
MSTLRKRVEQLEREGSASDIIGATVSTVNRHEPITAEAVLAVAADASDVLAGHADALEETERLTRAFDAAHGEAQRLYREWQRANIRVSARDRGRHPGSARHEGLAGGPGT